MKLENECGAAIQSPPRQKSYNPFDSDDEDTHAFVKSNFNAHDVKSFKIVDSSTSHLDTGDVSWEEVIFGQSSTVAHAIPANANGGEALFEKDADKAITERELPELMVHYIVNTDHSMKDIGIDEGVPAHDKVPIKSSENHGTDKLSAFLALNGSTNEYKKDASVENRTEVSLRDHRLDSEDLVKQHPIFLSKHDLSNKESNFSWPSTADKRKTSIRTYEIRHHGLSKMDEQNYVKVEEKRSRVSKEQGNYTVPVKHTEESSPRPSIMNGTEALAESSKSQREEATSIQSAELSAQPDLARYGVVNALSYNRKVESGILFLDFNSSTASRDEEKEEKEKARQNEAVQKFPETQTSPVEKPPEAQTMSRHDEGGPISIMASGIDRGVHGEIGSSAEMPFPASITSMGVNARSGSVSLRSESSTGSTRSFAFPVLQGEWNSSPVRMAKADTKQRHLSKHHGWFRSLFCCKF